MTIGGVDCMEAFGAEQWNVTPGYSTIKNGSEWTDGALQPILLPSTAGMKKYKVSVMIRGSTRQEIWKKGGQLIASLLKPCLVRLDGFEHNFMFVLTNASQAESCIQRFHKATLELEGYEYGNEVSVSYVNTKEIAITNEGDLETPCAVELIPTIGKPSLTVTGLVRDRNTGKDKPIVIKGITSGKRIILDADTGLITENGVNKFPDVEIYELPSLLPGANHITLNQDDINVTVKYKPRYV